MLLNNDQKSVFAEYYVYTVKLTFDLPNIKQDKCVFIILLDICWKVLNSTTTYNYNKKIQKVTAALTFDLWPQKKKQVYPPVQVNIWKKKSVPAIFCSQVWEWCEDIVAWTFETLTTKIQLNVCAKFEQLS